MNKKIGHFRLSNGDEIISSYTKTKTGYKLYEPAVVDEAMFNGQSSIVLARYLLSEDNTALLSANHVMTFSNVNVVVRNYYLNSVAYNRIYIYENMLKEIERVSTTMKQLVDGSSDIKQSFKYTTTRLVAPSSNTIN